MGYGTLGLWRSRSGESLGQGDGDVVDGLDDDRSLLQVWGKGISDIWLQPQQSSVKKLLDRWWRRWFILVVVPASIVSLVLASTS